MSSKPMICASCGHTGKPKSSTPGSILIEIVLWCCFLVPGLIYSIWRINKRHDVCGACGATQLLPPDSPMGKRLAQDLKG